MNGRRVAARKAMVEFLRSLDLRPIDWEEAVEATGVASPYLGDVSTAGMDIAQAVIGLITPDDEARLRAELQLPDDLPYEKKLTGQPRQNVLLEAGMALARFPSRTLLER